MDLDDAALLVAIREGSEHAFNRLIDRHQQSVRVFLRGLTSRADADDIAQETFLVAWSKAGRYRGGASVRSWLFAIAWRKAKDSHRRVFRRRQREADYHEGAAPSDGIGVAERLAVTQALQSLPLEQRAAVLLCLAEGLTHTEAADALGMPLGTVKSHVSRGRASLRAALGDSP
jgi:RNA polymerase sigma-70 factor (ECF subfamily)